MILKKGNMRWVGTILVIKEDRGARPCRRPVQHKEILQKCNVYFPENRQWYQLVGVFGEWLSDVL